MILTTNTRIKMNNALVDFIDFNLSNKKLERIFHKPIKGTGLHRIKSVYQTNPDIAILAMIFYQCSRLGYRSYETMNGSIVKLKTSLEPREAIRLAKLIRNNQKSY